MTRPIHVRRTIRTLTMVAAFVAALTVASVVASPAAAHAAPPIALGDGQMKIFASDAAAGDCFGNAVAISGDTAIVGAYHDDDKGVDSGSAYVYVRSGSTWILQAKLIASDGAAGDVFGYAVAISGDTAIVAAPYDDDRGTYSGSVYVYSRSGGSWTEEYKLTAGDGASLDFFGQAVAISGDTIVVGVCDDDDLGSSSGSAYVYTRSGSTWSQQSKIVASDGAAGDQFGNSVAVDGDTVIIGAQSDDFPAGSAYVYARSGSSWLLQTKLQTSDGNANGVFGMYVAISADTVVVGRGGSFAVKGLHYGTAHVFKRSGSTWTQQAKLVDSVGAVDSHVYSPVAISGNTLVAGDHAGVYIRTGDTWALRRQVVEGVGSISGDTAICGASLDDDRGTDAGAAWIMSATGASTRTAEDTDLSIPAPGVLLNDIDAEGDPLVAELASPPTHGSLLLSADGSFVYRPDAEWSGTDAFSYRAFDGTAYSAPAYVALTVDFVNDPPSFTKGPDITVFADSGSYQAPWATAVSAGPSETQAVSFSLSCGRPSLFTTQPSIDAQGVLRFSTAGTLGSTLVTARLTDALGASSEATFTIVVAERPTYTLTYTAGSGGTISGTSPQTVAYNGSGTAVTAVANTGYHFVSWSDGKTTAGRTDGSVVADKSVTAEFAINTYALTYTAGAGGTISGISPQTVALGGSGTAVTALPNSGYHFVSWSDGATTATRTDLVVLSDLTVTATFARNPLPKATVYTPHAPSTMYRNHHYTIYGYVKPRHSSGYYLVQLNFYLRNSRGVYVYHSHVHARRYYYSSTMTKYKATVSLPHSGRWRVRAYHSCSKHAGSYSGYDYITVK